MVQHFSTEGLDRAFMRCGVTVRAHPKGVKVIEVEPNSPASRVLKVRPNLVEQTLVAERDVIMRVNGHKVKGVAGFVGAIANAPRVSFDIQVYDLKTRSEEYYRIKLLP